MNMTETVSLIITAVGVVFGAYTYFSDCRRKRIANTILAYQRMQAEVFSKLNEWKPAEIKKATEDKTSVAYNELSQYLAETEHFCIGINQRLYDFETFYQLAHGFFDSEKGKIMPRLLPLIEAKTRYADEDYFNNIHKVWKRMEKRKKRKL